ncbi:MAG: amino acid ABC transporter permease [Pelagimonas sp.]|jgi:general L-amino acid transport system permease protein|nr:amino acid ABC transporter permease [Pelagimonas sp.]
MSDVSYVRTEMLPEQAPPPNSVGLVGWMRENLFSGVTNSILTVLFGIAIFYIMAGLIWWAVSPTGAAASLGECREILKGLGASTHKACWGVITERWDQLLYGFYPVEERWRPNLALIFLFVALIPVLFNMISRRMNWFLLVLSLLFWTFQMGGGVLVMALQAVLVVAGGYLAYTLVTTDKEARAEEIKAGAKRLPNPLIFSAIYPFLMPWLLWGGTLWGPLMVLAGFVAAAIVYRVVATTMENGLLAIILAVVVALGWWLVLASALASGLSSVIALELAPVESRDFGGFMLSIVIGVVAIACSLPLGIVLALGRQSDLFIVKTLCVGFIEFIRGVPLITLLFVASTLLNIFLPPGTSFDIILRVLIMVTLFAAAYMAEVIRGGLAALPKGQYEGADSLGLNYWQAQRLVIMPQALKISIPGIVSTFIGVFKDTTLVSVIGLLDPLGLSNSIRADQAWNGLVWELYGFIALLFFVVCFSMSRYSMYLERKLQTGHR